MSTEQRAQTESHSNGTHGQLDRVEGCNAVVTRLTQVRHVHELFEEQANLTPAAVALIHDGRSLTYAELNSRANQLARYLREHGVGPERLVAICMERSFEMVVSVLSVLKAGAAYVPLDPEYPAERLRYMLDDSAAGFILTDGKLRDAISPANAEVRIVDAAMTAAAGYATDNLSTDTGAKPADLLYVVYTSGSTGQPKGIAMPHRAMVNLMRWHQQSFGQAVGTRVLQFAALGFDVAFQEIFSTLCTGGSLVLLSEWARRDTRALAELVERQAIERLFLPPMMLQSLAELCSSEGRAPPHLRDVIAAGEQLRISPQIRALFSHIGSGSLHNHYGPAETHVVTTLCLSGDPQKWPTIPSIGRPISRVQIHLLDAAREPVANGSIGEIWIAGEGVACGYLNRPELTAERFRADAFSHDPSARMYKTGDLGRWRADGELEFLGRNDFQVKVRGFRVEPGEIEAQLLKHPQVQDVAVIACDDPRGDLSLVAYITRRDARELTIDELRRHLKASLPSYMIPAAFVELDHLPQTPNGKLDRQSLPTLDWAANTSQRYEAPQGELEQTLAQVWVEVLKIDRIGRTDNFFELGGHSLLVAQMLMRLHRRGLIADVRCIYESPTLAALARTITRSKGDEPRIPANRIPAGARHITPEMLPLVALSAAHIESIVQAVPGGAANVQEIYPLAPLQEGVVFHHLLNQQKPDVYVLPILLELSSRESIEKLTAALEAAIQRHDVLRTAVHWERLPQPVQVVYRKAHLPVDVIELDSGEDAVDQLRKRMRPECLRMDVQKAPLLSLQLAKDPRGSAWYGLLRLHHLVCDHEALDALLAEIMAHASGQADEQPLPSAYRVHVAQARAHNQAQEAQAEKFFREKLHGIEETSAPFGLLDVRGDGTRVEQASVRLEAGVARAIRDRARLLGVTPATLFHAAWGLVVAQTTGREDIVFGTLLSGRLQQNAGAQHALGMFINTLPLRLQLQGLSAEELVRHAQRELIDVVGHVHVSLAVAQRCSGLHSTAPLFTTLLNCLHSTQHPQSQDIRVLAINEWTNYPIAMIVDDDGEHFTLSAQTDRSIDPRRISDYLAAAVRSLVVALERSPEMPVLSLSILTDQERDQVLRIFNSTADLPGEERLIHQLFEEQAERNPAATALVCGAQQLSYLALNQSANRLAHSLRRRGVSPDTKVAIYLERGPSLVIGLLGVLKAGGAYVPIDVTYPVDRVEYMLRDSAPLVVLTSKQLMGSLPVTGAQVIALDGESSELSAEPQQNPPAQWRGLSTQNLAYVIYTSGSTGSPKGVLVEHRHLLNLVRWHCTEFNVREGSQCSSLSSVGFDATTWEIWSSLCAGATLHLAPPELSGDVERMLAWWASAPLHVSFLPTPMAELALSREAYNPALRTLLTGGDRLRVANRSGAFELVNNYGPTESAVVATSGRINEQDAVIHIGRPIANTQIYILDRYLNPVPIGVSGEIYIGGRSVARGYLNNEVLTKERFIRDPYSEAQSARMYRTGDLARWREDGTIEYLGRNDQQVKIRGFRIELGEIEAQLLRYEPVREAVVLAREDLPGGPRLVAYVTRRDARELDIAGLRAHLKSVLPDYMLPAAFVVMEALPLTSNGKLDRRALPPPAQSVDDDSAFEAPQGAMEEAMARIWQDVLQVERVGRGDDFFELGGHSLLATQLTARIRADFLVELPVGALFESPTLQEIAGEVARLRAERLVDTFADANEEIQKLLKTVASMNANDVQAMVRQLSRDTQP